MSKNTKMAFLRRFMEDESGISAVEYGLLAAGIAVGLWAIIGGPAGIGTNLQAVFTDVQTEMTSAAAE